METAVIVLSDTVLVLVICGGFSIRHYMVKYYSEILKKEVPGAEAWHERYGYSVSSMLADMFRSVNV